MHTKRAFFDHIAIQALEEYDIEDLPVEFLQHSDNVTYRVGGARTTNYLLRIHTPVSANMGTHGSDPRMINSELLWLEALQRSTDLVLQKPIRNRMQELITQVATKRYAAPLNCTLLRWVPGRPFQPALENEETARQIGAILAKLHRQASQWRPPPEFTRPLRDESYFVNVLRNLSPAVQDGRIGTEDFAVLERSIDRLIDLMRTLDRSPQNYGVMHADAHKGNFVFHDGHMRLIDFSFCALGNYMFDLGICLSDMREDLHAACLDGYQRVRALPDRYPRLIEGFFIGSIVGTFSYWVANPNAQERLVTEAPEIVKDFALKFNRDEYFWFTH